MSDVQFVTADVMTLPVSAFVGFDTLIVDPPYSPYVHANMASHGSDGRGSVARDPGFGALSSSLRERIAEISGVMRRWSVIFCDLESTHLWRYDVERFGAKSRAEYIRETRLVEEGAVFDVPWVRWSQPQLSGDRPPQGAEAVLHFHPRGKKVTNCPGNLTHYGRRCMRGADKHPTEKPLDLMLDMVSWWSDPGQSVVDVCAGSGTTALACAILGRDCLAVEADPKWVDVYHARMAMHGPGPQRDHDRAVEWVTTTEAEASAHLAKPPAKDGEDENTRRRAQCRLDDAARVQEWLR